MKMDNDVEKRFYESAKLPQPMRREKLRKNSALHVDSPRGGL